MIVAFPNFMLFSLSKVFFFVIFPNPKSATHVYKLVKQVLLCSPLLSIRPNNAKSSKFSFISWRHRNFYCFFLMQSINILHASIVSKKFIFASIFRISFCRATFMSFKLLLHPWEIIRPSLTCKKIWYDVTVQYFVCF